MNIGNRNTQILDTSPSQKIQAIAFYLPQYHPIPENNDWWGAGFTEWSNVARARPLFRRHYQPHIPADLGFYDLRLEETRVAQADLARLYGIYGFCYYHYWFGNGKRLLERPFNEVLQSGKPDFPFCVAWANQNWSGIWHGLDKEILCEQTYPGPKDHQEHFDLLLPAFLDKRYITIDDKALFVIYSPEEIPNSKETLELWRSMATKAGMNGLYIVAYHHSLNWPFQDFGYDAIVHVPFFRKRRQWVPWSKPIEKIYGKLCDWIQYPTVEYYSEFLDYLIPKIAAGKRNRCFPCVIPNWDNTPRSGAKGFVLRNSSPDLFKLQVRRAASELALNSDGKKIFFIKSWNEWAEGNHMEPDQKFGHGYLRAFAEELNNANKKS